GDVDTDDTSDTDTEDTSDTDDTDEPEEPVQATTEGVVRVQLYTEDEDGERTYISWSDAYKSAYPFGSIFLTSYTEGKSGDIDYHGSTVISASDVTPDTGNQYSITVNLTEEGTVNLYAAVDYWADGIIGTDEPIGVYPDEVEIIADEDVEGLDITILVPYHDFSSTGSGGGSGCDDVSITGDIDLTRDYSGGRAVAMLVDNAGNGPYDWGWSELSATDDGATGTYSIATCEDYGSLQLRGAWDSNGNDLIDPADVWGSYANDDGVDANPISIGSNDLPGYDILIPLGSGGLSVIPYSRLSGTLDVGGGDFGDLPKDTDAVYVVALKYRPTTGISLATLYEQAYDIQEFEPADFAGQSSIDWSLSVPSNSIIYLWAYSDSGNIGTVNESGEFIASGGDDDNGKMVTSSGLSEGNNMTLGQAPE
ncbi:MAG: hypothetical protein ACI8RZ_007752, partial [Myxococcota bacterium]